MGSLDLGVAFIHADVTMRRIDIDGEHHVMHLKVCVCGCFYFVVCCGPIHLSYFVITFTIYATRYGSLKDNNKQQATGYKYMY